MKARVGTIDPMVITVHRPLSPAAEGFRGLRTNLQFLGMDKPLKSILITSAAPGEGKSTTGANLAVAFAQTGARVCLVDADLRRPTVASLFGLPHWKGLTTALLDENGLEGALQTAGVEGLTVLTSGPIPPNPAEMLGAARMTRLLAHLEERFDMVILDAPPVLPVTDAAVLAPRVGGVLLVTRSGVTPRRQVQRAAEALRAVQANLLGSVLSAVRAAEESDYYASYYVEEPGRQSRKPPGGWLSRFRRSFGGRRSERPAVASRAAQEGGTD